MVRDKDRKSVPKVMGEYTCPECGKTQILVVSKKRQRCPDCARARNKKAASARFAKEIKDSRKIMREGLKPAAPKKSELSEEEKAYRKQLKQCKGCHWWRSNDGGSTHCCHYYLRHGVGYRRDKGNGPGDCRSFEPKKKLSRKQMIEEAKKILEQIEADYNGQKPQKGEKANG